MMLSLLTVAFAADLELTVTAGDPIDPLIAQPFVVRRYTHEVRVASNLGGSGGAGGVGGAEKGPLTLVRDADLLSPNLYRFLTSTGQGAHWTLTTFRQTTTGTRIVGSTLEFQELQATGWKLVMGPMGLEEQLTIDYGRYRRCDYSATGVPTGCSSWDFIQKLELW